MCGNFFNFIEERINLYKIAESYIPGIRHPFCYYPKQKFEEFFRFVDTLDQVIQIFKDEQKSIIYNKSFKKIFFDTANILEELSYLFDAYVKTVINRTNEVLGIKDRIYEPVFLHEEWRTDHHINVETTKSDEDSEDIWQILCEKEEIYKNLKMSLLWYEYPFSTLNECNEKFQKDLGIILGITDLTGTDQNLEILINNQNYRKMFCKLEKEFLELCSALENYVEDSLELQQRIHAVKDKFPAHLFDMKKEKSELESESTLSATSTNKDN